MFTRRLILPGLAALLPVLASAQATPPSVNETKLRDALRNSTTQLRQVQEDLATTRTALDAKTADLTALTKKTTAESRKLTTELADTAAKLKERTETAERTAAKLKEAEALAARWKSEAEMLHTTLLRADADRGRLKIVLDRTTTRLAHREAQNTALVTLSGEILTRFEQYGLGEAIAGKDTFIGLKRVALRNYVQEQSDRIADAKVIPGSPAPAETASAR